MLTLLDFDVFKLGKIVDNSNVPPVAKAPEGPIAAAAAPEQPTMFQAEESVDLDALYDQNNAKNMLDDSGEVDV